MKRIFSLPFPLLCILFLMTQLSAQPYKVVDTGVKQFSGNSGIIAAPTPGSDFYGQDATYSGNQPSYTNNSDGTITDNVTGLMWQKDMGAKITYAAAFVKADTMTLGGHTDWRVPTIKELYSLILFTGQVSGISVVKRFIDSVYFKQPLGDTSIGERQIDAQTWSSTQLKGLTMAGDSTVFGVNFLDGRIKGYPKYQPGSNNTIPRTMYFRMVRGNTSYGINNFIDNNDGTITDLATGLMWQKTDDGNTRDWKSALAYAESLTLASYSDWRLPNAKEMQSIVDYSRNPVATNSPAINPVFVTTSISDPNGNPGQYPYFWTGTTLLDGPTPYVSAIYIAFGKAQGKMNGVLMDVHGAGAQRSDPKTGNRADYPKYFGPQGDVQYVFNYVRCVRDVNSPSGGNFEKNLPGDYSLEQNYPNPFNPETTISFGLPEASSVKLEVFNVSGEVVATLINREMEAGLHKVQVSSKELHLASGVYCYRIICSNSKSSGAFTQTKKMILLQ